MPDSPLSRTDLASEDSAVGEAESFVRSCSSVEQAELRKTIMSDDPSAEALESARTALSASPRLTALADKVLTLAHPIASLNRIRQSFPEIAADVPSLRIPLWRLISLVDDRVSIDGRWATSPNMPDARASLDAAARAHATADRLSSLYSISDDLRTPASELAEFAQDAGYDVRSGHLIPRDLAVPSRLAALLALAGEPLPLSNLLELMQPDRSESSVRNALIGDERFVKSDRRSWALARWGTAAYVPIHRQIAAIVDERGSIGIDRLVAEIMQSYDVKEHSIRTYASTGDFTTTGDVVTRRTHKYVPRKSPSKTKHLYRDGSTVRWRTTIGPVHRKGSAFNLPSALSALIEVGPGSPREFTTRLGPQSVIWVSVQARSGTIKRFVEDMNLTDGEDVFLEFDGDTFDIVRVPTYRAPTARALVQQIGHPVKRTSVPAALKLLTEALWLQPTARRGEIIDVLRGRRELELLALVEAVVAPDRGLAVPSR